MGASPVRTAAQRGTSAASDSRHERGASLKPDGTELTPADVEVERLIRALIAERFPGDRTYGEEGEVSDRDRARGARVGFLNPSTWSESLLLALHREVALMPWVPLGTGVAAGLAEAAVITGHPMGYHDLVPMSVLMAEAGGRVARPHP